MARRTTLLVPGVRPPAAPAGVRANTRPGTLAADGAADTAVGAAHEAADGKPLLQSVERDGTSQAGRRLAALDPAYAPIDGRGTAELLDFVQALCKQLRYCGTGDAGDGTWMDFAAHLGNGKTDIATTDMAAYLADPARFAGDAQQRRWLGRPHFALLLVFLELLGWARDQQNGLTGRHLDWFYRDLLRMRPRPPEPDRATVLFQLAPGVSEARVPAGTALDAGRDSAGNPLIYRTERELVVNRAEVAEVRSVYMHVAIVGFDDLSLTGPKKFDAMLRLAFGEPRPGDAIPQVSFNGSPNVNRELLSDLNDAGKDEERARLAAFLGIPSDGLNKLCQEAAKKKEIDWTYVKTTLAASRLQCVCSRLASKNLDKDQQGFDAAVDYVLARLPSRSPDTIAGLKWPDKRALLETQCGLTSADLRRLDALRQALDQTHSQGPTPTDGDWRDCYSILLRAWRRIEPQAYQSTRDTLYAYADARACRPDPTSPRWKTFGGTPNKNVEGQKARRGWALRSPLLSLSQGQRTLTLTLGLDATDGAFWQGLGIDLKNPSIANFLSVWAIQISSAKGWIDFAAGRSKMNENTGPAAKINSVEKCQNGLKLQLSMSIDPSCDPIAPLKDSPDTWPTLRMLLRDGRPDPNPSLPLKGVDLEVEVEGLTDLKIRQEDRRIDPKKPFEPFGNRPMAGSRCYIGHPELVRNRLAKLDLSVDWIGLPANLDNYCTTYKLNSADVAFDLDMIDSGVSHRLQAPAQFSAKQSIKVSGDQFNWSGYTPQLDSIEVDDLRTAGRCLCMTLNTDFGHDAYPRLAAQKAAELAMAIATKPSDIKTDDYVIPPPYTPTIARLTAGYKAQISIKRNSHSWDSDSGDAVDQLLHIHPFGESPIDPKGPTLLPRYDQAGELYIGLRGLVPPQHLALLVQLAEGTGNPDLEPVPLAWSCLDGDRWTPVVPLADGTRGLLNSGIVELALPAVAPSTRLPARLYWLRVAIPRNPASRCDCIDIQAQAAAVRFEDHGNAPDHYDRPLPKGRITRLLEADGRIAALVQPYSAYSGRPPEPPELLRTRTSERLRHKQRALAPWDYERLVLERFPQIYKAKCIPAGDGPGRVRVIVIPNIRGACPGDSFAPKAPADLLGDIRTYLAGRAPPSAGVTVCNARYEGLGIRLSVCFRPGQEVSLAVRRLRLDLIRYLSPWAFDKGAEIMFGGRIHLNSVIEFTARLDYVDYAGHVVFWTSNDTASPYIERPKTDEIAAATLDGVLVSARYHFISVMDGRAEDPATDQGDPFNGAYFLQSTALNEI